MNKLQIEIIKRIFFDFGISFSDNERNDIIINDDNFCDYFSSDSNENSIPVWGAELQLADTILRVMISDLSDDDLCEFVLAIAYQDLALYGIRLSDASDDEGSFCVKTGSTWVDAPIGMQSSVLNGVEQLQDYVFNWKKISNVEIKSNLRSDLVDFINLVEVES